jgi:two-component system response regulator
VRADPEILLVEDNADDIAIAKRAFRQSELENRVAIARDGTEALEYLFDGGQHPLPKVILLDLKMPRIDGKEVLRRVRSNERTRHIPVVIVSSSAHPDDIKSCYRLGANSFVVKQYTSGEPGKFLADVATYWLSLNRIGY